MKIYLAARYERRDELCGYRSQLEAAGHSVTSRWLNGKHEISDDAEGSTNCPDAARLRFANEDVEDVFAAEALISFTEPPRSKASRGGRHVEFGMRLGGTYLAFDAVRLFVVGHRENIFHWLPHVEFFATWAEALDRLKESGTSLKGESNEKTNEKATD